MSGSDRSAVVAWPSAARAGPGDARRAHPLSHGVGGVALAAAPRAHLRRASLRGPRQLPLPRHRSALLEGRPGHRGFHRRLGPSGGGGGCAGRPRPPRAAMGIADRALAPPPRLGAARGSDGQALRMALQPRRRLDQLRPGRCRPQLARRSATRPARADPCRRVADHALRDAPLLRAAPRHSRRDLRGGAARRRRRGGDLDPRHPAAPPTHPPDRRALPHPRRHPVVRSHVRADGGRPRRHHGDAHRLRVPESLSSGAARPRLRRGRGGLRAGDADSVGIPPSAPERRDRGVKPTSPLGRLRDGLVLVAFLLYATPFLWQLLTAFKPEAELMVLPPLLPTRLTWEHFRAVLGQSVMLRALTLGLFGAYGLTRYPVPGKGLLLLFIVAGTAFPQIATVSPLFLLLRALGLRDTWLALILANTSFALPLVIWLLTGFLQEVPAQLEEAAAVDGASRPRAFRWIVLPLLAPGLASAALLTFLFSWNEFLFAYTFTATEASRTVPVALALFPGVFEVPWGDIAAASMLASVPPVILVIVLQRYLVRGLLGGALRE